MTTAARIPFVVGQWVRGDRFYGRQAQITEILDGPRNSLWLVGTRRIGKTSILKQLELLTSDDDERGYVPLFWDLQGAESPRDLHLDFAEAILDAEDRLAALGIPIGDIESDDLFTSLARLRRQLRARQRRLLLLCDEVEELIHLDRQEPALLRKLRRALQSTDAIRTVLASTVLLWELAKETAETSPFLHGFTPPLYLPPLDDTEARELLRQARGQDESRSSLDETAIDTICERCGNHPYLLQLVGKRALETGDLDRAVDQIGADRTVRHFFAVDLELLSSTERWLLHLIERRQPVSRRSLEESRDIDPESMSAGLLELENLGLLRRADDEFRLASPFFGRWLHELDSRTSGGPTAAREQADPRRSRETLEGLGLIDGRYRLLRLVGEGGNGFVYEAHDTLLDSKIALKLLRPEFARQPMVLERLRQETVLSRDLGHPNILRVYHLGQHGDQSYVTMSWVEGPNLENVIAAESPIPEPLALSIGAKLASALEAAHAKGVLHRDVKPANVLISPDGEPLLCDFGLARPAEGDGITQAGVFLGTPAYASPEQADMAKVDARSDVYSLGVVLFEMATGQRPFTGETVAEVLDLHRRQTPPDPRQIEPSVSDELATIILRCLEKDPARRFTSAGELRRALEERNRLLADPPRVEAPDPPGINEESPTGGLGSEELFALVYDELRRLAYRHMGRERQDHTLQPTALVHEAYLRLADGEQDGPDRVSWQGRGHFLAVASRAMRRLLVDHARGRGRIKRGGGAPRVTLNEEVTPFERDVLEREELLQLDAALERLRELDARQAIIVELRFFSGLTVEEVAQHLGVSKRTVEAEWTRAREWLRRELAGDGDQDPDA